MGPIWGRQDPGGLHVGPMILAIWEVNLLPVKGSGSHVHALLLTVVEARDVRVPVGNVGLGVWHHCVAVIWEGKSPTLRWRPNERDGVSNYRHLGCLLNRLFRRWSKKTSKLHVTGLCEGSPTVTGGIPSQRPVTRKMFPYDAAMPVGICESWIFCFILVSLATNQL